MNDDFIDLRNENPPLVGLAVGDVTGHGIGAALLMASIRVNRPIESSGAMGWVKAL